jgi:hypothetical protein
MPGSFSAASLPKSVQGYFEHLRTTLGPEDLASLLEEFRSDWTTTPTNDGPLPDAALYWETWLQLRFPSVCSSPFGSRHRALWEWFEALTPQIRPRPRVEIWPRGGAKSSSAELGLARVGVKLSRRFGLYVSETQDQADRHVQSIASLFESCGVERALTKYGHSKGWRRNQLRTANGFNVAAIGLDTAARGVKLDEYRPDVIVYDDLDNQHDTLKTIERKIATLTGALLPTEGADCAHLFVQNLIHDESIFSQLVDGRADFLHDREPACLEPAVRGLTYTLADRGDGQKIYRITGGEPTWAGQGLKVCEHQLNTWGLAAFLREAQHEVTGAGGYFFDVTKLQTVAACDVPALISVCLAWDLAATEGGGDWTVGALIGKAANGCLYVLAIIRGQWASDRVRGCIKLTRNHYRALFPKLRERFPQDPGQAGKDQAGQFQREFPGAQIRSVTGDKATRASGLADSINRGNVYLVQQDLPEWLETTRSADTGGKPLMTANDRRYATWHARLREEFRKFREDERDQVDDTIDAAADSHNDLHRKTGDVF